MFENLWRYSQRAALAAGVAASVALFVFVRPPATEVEDRQVVELWRVIGSENVEPPTWDWFNETQDDVYVQKTGLPFLEIEQKFLTSVVGGDPPDLFEYFGSVVQWSTRGALMPLDDLMERDGFDREAIFPALWDEMTWDGRTYAIPTGTANEAFYWNKEHFREAGLDPDRPPQTWAELEEYARKLTTYNDDGSIARAGYIPGYWNSGTGPLFLNWPMQMGVTFLSGDGTEVTLATEEAIEALEWEVRLFEELGRDALIRKRASFGYGSQHGFMSGRLSMIVQKSSFVQEIEQFGGGMEYGVSILPIPEGGQPATTAGPAWIGIPAGASDPDAAWEYIKFYTSDPVQLRWANFAAEHDLASFFPANVAAATSPEQMTLPHMEVFTESMEYGVSSTVVPMAHTVFWREYTAAWDAAIRGEKDPREALEDAQAAIQRALDDQIEYNQFYRQHVREQYAAK